MGEIQKSEKGRENGIVKGRRKLWKRTVRRIKEKGGTSCKLIWTDC